MLQRNLLSLITFIFWSWRTLNGVVSDPQTHFLHSACDPFDKYAVSDFSIFNENRNATFRNIKEQVSNQNKHFATADQANGANPVHALFQCRDYLSVADCISCFDVAARNCPAGAIGARVVYDGCFLRYETASFYDEMMDPMTFNTVICENQVAVEATTFTATVRQVLMNLEIATPRIPGFSAATKMQVPNGPTIYAYAQCFDIVTQSKCLDCLKIGYSNMQTCLPNLDGRASNDGCFMRYSTTSFFVENQTIDITALLKQGSSKKGAIIGGVAGGVTLVLILLALFTWIRRPKRPKRVLRGNILGRTELKGLVNYSYKDLKFATKNFSEENKLGEGGFGVVYKGTQRDGKIIAIKKLTLRQSKRMEEDFESEVKLISNVHHRNLIRLLGCCSKGHHRILVYEYMKNKSLDRFLFGKKKGSLNWKQRFDIILGTARGLAYLHEECHICIIHRDVKTNNILLDDDLQPRIADFGLARLLPEDKSHLSTKFAGTLGYTAPEYAIYGQLSVKADTYSYGVVVLEIISGKKNSALKIDVDAESEFLLQKAWKLYERSMHLELVDNTLDPNDYDTEEVKKIIEIALLCTQASATIRPTMSEVVVLLTNIAVLEHMRPTMPVFV